MRPSKRLTLDAIATLSTGWNKSEDIRWGDDGAINTHAHLFSHVISYPGPIDLVCCTVLYSSTNDMQNISSPSTAPPHIPLPLLQEIEFETEWLCLHPL